MFFSSSSIQTFDLFGMAIKSIALMEKLVFYFYFLFFLFMYNGKVLVVVFLQEKAPMKKSYNVLGYLTNYGVKIQ